MLISDGYREQLQQLHGSDESWGSGSKWFVGPALKVWRDMGKPDVIDYGCGKGDLSKYIPGTINYDPGIPKFSEVPTPAPLLVSCCVLEHVEPECVDAVLDHMASLALERVLLAVSYFPSSMRLPDGRDVHLTVQPIDWWVPKMMERWLLHTAMKIQDRRFMFFGRTKQEEGSNG